MACEYCGKDVPDDQRGEVPYFDANLLLCKACAKTKYDSDMIYYDIYEGEDD